MMTYQRFSASREQMPRLPRRVLFAVGSVAVGALLMEYGFKLEASFAFWLHLLEGLLAVLFVTHRAVMLLRAPDRWALIRQRRIEYAVLTLFLVLSAGWLYSTAVTVRAVQFLHEADAETLGVNLVQLFLLTNVVLLFLRLQQRLLAKSSRPEWILTGSFAMLILVGTLLLLLPRANSVAEKPIGLLDALFTSTSAACVTGLAVCDTGTAFTPVGQFIILVLMQVGGLGIMTFVAFLAVTSAESLPMAHMLALRQTIGARSLGRLKQQVWTIVLFTALIESIGALCLYACLPGTQGPFGAMGVEHLPCHLGFLQRGICSSGRQSDWHAKPRRRNAHVHGVDRSGRHGFFGGHRSHRSSDIALAGDSPPALGVST